MKRKCPRGTCLGWTFRMFLALWFSRDEHFAGGAFAGAYRPVHVAVPHLRCLRASPVDSAHRLPKRLAVARPHSGPEAPTVTAPTPLLGGPVFLDVLVGIRGTWSEELREHREDQLLAFLGCKLPGHAGVPALQETQEYPAAKIGRRVVEDDAHLVVEGKDGSGEALSTPEGLWVGDLHLGDVAHGHLLGELVPKRRQRGKVADPAGQRRRQGHYRPPRPDDAAVVGYLHAPVVLADRADRRAKPHCVTQPVGEPQSKLLRTSLQSALLGTVVGGHEPIQRAPRPAVEQEVQQRHLRRLGTEQRRNHRAPIAKSYLGLRVGNEPRVHRLRVPGTGVLGTPRRLERNLVRHLL